MIQNEIWRLCRIFFVDVISSLLKISGSQSQRLIEISKHSLFGVFGTQAMSNGRKEEDIKVLRGHHFEQHKHQIFTSTFIRKLELLIMIDCN